MVPDARLSGHDRRVAELLQENELLRERVRQLEELVRPPVDPCRAYVMALGLTRTEAKVFCVIAEREFAPYELIRSSVWGHLDEPVSEHIVATMLFKVNRKVMPLGIRVRCVWAEGAMLDAASKGRLRQIIAEWEAAGSPAYKDARRRRNIEVDAGV